MRRTLFAAGLGLLLTHPLTAQQFGEDRRPPATKPAPKPAAPPAAAPARPAELPAFPTGPVAAKPAERVPLKPEAPHEWAVAAGHGNWMVCVKSYVGAKAKADAEELAGIIRNQHKAAAYLFERNAEERQREEQRQADFRARKEAELAPFLQVQAAMKARAESQGIEYVNEPATYKMPKTTIEPQWAVLVGGFPDAETARKALDTIRDWPVPANTALLDKAVATRPGPDGKAILEAAYINPFRAALVVPNPAAKSVALAEANAADPMLITYNEAEPYSLLKAEKGWTLIVKDLTIPSTTQSKDQEGGIMARLFGDTSEADKMLHATARQAFELAKMIRSDSMTRSAAEAAKRVGLTPRPLESFVLHHHTGSRVTVGQFDGPDDPALLEMQHLLANVYFQVWDKPQAQGGRLLEERRMFDGITPMPVPRPKPGK